MEEKTVMETIGVKVVKQGKAVIQVQWDRTCIVMYPDGQMDEWDNRDTAEMACRRWFKRHLGRGSKMGVGTIEIRLPEEM